jgi:hypothetical protein
MRTKKSLLALSTAIAFVVLGAATAAQAGSRDDDESGGSKIGPLGQVFSSGQAYTGRNSYGFVAPSQSQHTTHKHTVRRTSK